MCIRAQKCVRVFLVVKDADVIAVAVAIKNGKGRRTFRSVLNVQHLCSIWVVGGMGWWSLVREISSHAP